MVLGYWECQRPDTGAGDPESMHAVGLKYDSNPFKDRQALASNELQLLTRKYAGVGPPGRKPVVAAVVQVLVL